MVADIFALGVIVFILNTGRMPFESATIDDDIYKYIASSK